MCRLKFEHTQIAQSLLTFHSLVIIKVLSGVVILYKPLSRCF